MNSSLSGLHFPYIKRFTILLALTLVTPGVGAQPYIPSGANTVVETLPESIIALSRKLRSEAPAHSTVGTERRATESLSEVELVAIQQQALAAYRVAAETGEPRAYGHTLALLERWPEGRPRPALIHVLSAAVLQHNHEFPEALAELISALAIEPNNAQAHLMRAQISLVTADYDTARESCLALRTLIRYPLAMNCQAQLDGVTGRAEQALAQVNDMLQRKGELSPQDHLELNITAAGIAHRLGRVADAERHYVAALQVSPASGYTLVNYAALLIENRRFDDVVSLLDSLDEGAMSTEMQILLAEALSARQDMHSRDRAQALTLAIQESFDAAVARGEGLPAKEFSRFALTLQQRPAEALAAARKNWALQKEPSDTLLLAQAARSAGDVEQLTEIRRWTQLHGTQDVRLSTLLSAALADANADQGGA